MIANFKRFLTPDMSLHDPEETRLAGLLHAILMVTIGLNLVLTPVALFVYPDHLPIGVWNGLLLAAQLITLYLLRAGYAPVSSFLFCTALWAYITGFSFMLGGFSSMLPIGYILLALVAGILFRSPLVHLFNIVSLLSLAAFFYAEIVGNILPPPLVATTPGLRAIVISGVFLAMVVVLRLTLRGYSAALNLAEREIRERRETEAERQRILTALNAAFDAIFILDLDSFRFTYVNRGAINQTGYSEPELLALTPLDISPVWDEPAQRAVIAPLVEGRESKVSFETVIRRRDGELLPVKVNLQLIDDPVGEGRLLAVSRDIKEQKQAQSEILSSRERLNNILVSSNLATWEWNVQTGEGILNRRWAEILGYSLDELTPFSLKQWMSLLHPDDLGRFEELMNRHLAGETPFYECDLRLKHKDGRWIWVHDRGQLISLTADGQPEWAYGTHADITARKQAEETLRLAQARLQHLITSSPAAIYSSKASGDYDTTYMSDNVYALLGYEPQLFTEDPNFWINHIHPEDRPRVLESIMALHGGGAHTYEYRFQRQDGAYRWVHDSAQVVFDAQGNPLEVVGSWLDVTERQEALESLRESEERLRLTLRAANQGLYDLDIQTGTAAVSEEYARMLGYDPAEFEETNAAWLARLHPDDHERTAAAYQAYITGKIPEYRVEFRLRTASGDWKWILSVGRIVAHDPEGRPRRMLGTHTDLTQSKQAQAALRQSEERYRMLVETLDVALCRWLPDTTLTFANERYRQLFAIQDIKSPIKWVTFLPESTREQTLAFYDQLARNPRTESYDHLVTLADGRLRHYQWLDTPILDLNGQVVEFQSVGIDITERKAAEDNVRNLNVELEQRVARRTAQLQAANEELEAFAYSVSHDLRAPLRAMEGFSSALLAHSANQLDAQSQHYLDRIQQAARRMGQLISDLLTLSRVTRRDLNWQPVNLSRLAREIAAELHKEEPERQVLFTIADGLEIEGDRDLLFLALYNLISNAWKFAAGRAPAQIEFGVVAREQDGVDAPPAVGDPQAAIYFVRDNGVGFDMAYANKLFTPFQRLHAMNEFPGTGIGLATVQRILARHGGRIWTEATVDQGAVFYFVIGDNHER